MAFDVDERIAELEAKILEAYTRIDNLEGAIAREEERLPRAGVIERAVIRGTVESLRRSIVAELGWIRRWEREIEKLKGVPPPPPPPPIPEYLITDEDADGNQIYWVPDLGIYRVRDPSGVLLRTVIRIAISWTGSIATRTGHDTPLTVEITATTAVRGMDRAGVTRVEGELERGVLTWSRRAGFYVKSRIIKTGIEYSDEMRAVGVFGYMPPDYPTAHLIAEKRSPRIRSYEEDIVI